MNLGQVIAELQKQGDELYSLPGKVLALNLDAGTCDVELFRDDSQVLDVRLFASPSDHNGLSVVPKVGSTVLVCFLNKDTGFISLVSAPAEVKVDLGQTELQIDADGVRIKRGQEDLFTILRDLLTQLQAITVPTPAGPSGVPVNAPAFNVLSTRLKTLLKS